MAVENKGDAGSAGAGQDSATKLSDATKLTEGSSGGTASLDKGKGGDKTGGKGSGGGGGGGSGGGGGGRGPGSNSDKGKESLGEKIQALSQSGKEVVIEFKKISWPERSQIIRETSSVLVLVTIITLLVLGFDWFLSHAVFQPLEQWARLHGGGLGGRGGL